MTCLNLMFWLFKVSLNKEGATCRIATPMTMHSKMVILAKMAKAVKVAKVRTIETMAADINMDTMMMMTRMMLTRTMLTKSLCQEVMNQ